MQGPDSLFHQVTAKMYMLLLFLCPCSVRGKGLAYFQCLDPFCKANEPILSDLAYCEGNNKVLGKL